MQYSYADVTASISTKDRYDTLILAITSIANQTLLPKKILIFDDGEQIDLRKIPTYHQLFNILDEKNIEWEVIFGDRKGQVLNHQKALNISKTEWVLRVDDDNILEPDVLENLINVEDDVGAIGSLVKIPDTDIPLEQTSPYVKDCLHKYCPQMTKVKGIIETEHLHNTFLIRKKAASHGYCLDLSPVGHREETIFSYEMFRKGWKLLINGDVTTWHLKHNFGGIRSYSNEELWEHDEQIFQQKMREWEVPVDKKTSNKLIALVNGIGDNWAFKHILSEIVELFSDKKIKIATFYPDVFWDTENIEVVHIETIPELKHELQREKFDIYKWMIDNNWQGMLMDAYKGMFLS